MNQAWWPIHYSGQMPMWYYVYFQDNINREDHWQYSNTLLWLESLWQSNCKWWCWMMIFNQAWWPTLSSGQMPMFQPLLCSLLELHFENSFENVLILFLYSEFLSIFWVPLNILCQFQFSCLAPPACRNVMHTALSPIILSPPGHCCPIVNIRGHPPPARFPKQIFQLLQ